MMSKISVKGDDKHPLYKYLTEDPTAGEFAGEIGGTSRSSSVALMEKSFAIRQQGHARKPGDDHGDQVRVGGEG